MVRSLAHGLLAGGFLLRCALATGCSADDRAPSTPDGMDALDAAAEPVTLRNPVRRGAADPFLWYVDGAYYLTYTAVNRIEVVRARSISELGAATPTVIWRDSTPSRCCNMWAPELHRIGARWYVYYTADDGQIGNHRMFVLESAGDDPLGPYTFKAKLATQDFFAIDGTVVELDGAPYFVWSGVPPTQPKSQNLYLARMSNPWTLTGPTALLSAPYLSWETKGVGGTIERVNEAPAALYRDGKAFIVFSASQCATPDYALGTLSYANAGGGPLATSSWTKSDDPQFAKTAANQVYGPGHNSFFTSPDGTEVWNAYHAVDKPQGSCGGDRSLRVQRIGFRADGSPELGVPVATTEVLTAPSGDPGPQP
ncbi:MAG: glycoside hydrolase family 43 protein [Myxococcota bacterium]|nr:glycoside hydrolase family 43 protein [Myxococcota bacterium]